MTKDNPINVEEEIRNIIFNYTADYTHEQLIPSLTLRDDVWLDALDMMELTMEIETVFYITIPDVDTEKWVTIGDVIDYVKESVA